MRPVQTIIFTIAPLITALTLVGCKSTNHSSNLQSVDTSQAVANLSDADLYDEFVASVEVIRERQKSGSGRAVTATSPWVIAHTHRSIALVKEIQLRADAGTYFQGMRCKANYTVPYSYQTAYGRRQSFLSGEKTCSSLNEAMAKTAATQKAQDSCREETRFNYENPNGIKFDGGWSDPSAYGVNEWYRTNVHCASALSASCTSWPLTVENLKNLTVVDGYADALQCD